ncbi:tetratricopeptide repeat protein [Myxococcota bacterium]|nr:tetratricopeptide repeat protein [Myxococcota bacterium]
MTTKRFQYWQLTGQGKIVGLAPVPAGTTPSYFVELDYGAANLPVEVREHVEGHAAPLVRKPTFENGRLKFSEYTDPIRDRTGKNCYEYDDRGFLKQRYELDPKGKIRFKVEIRCDARGNFAEERLFDHRGRLKEHRRYEHDSKGLLEKEWVYGGRDGEVLEGTFTLAYDARGNVVRRTWHGPDGVAKRAFAYTYDAHDRRVGLAVEERGEKVMSLAKELGDDGRVKSAEVLDGAGARVALDTVVEPGHTVHAFLGALPDHALNDTERALLAGTKKLGEVLGISKRHVEALTMVAYSHLEGRRYAEARRLFEALAALDPDDTYALGGAGAAALLQGQPQAALAWYDRALDREPSHAASRGGRAEALFRLGRVDEAITLWKALFAELAPEDPVVRHAREVMLSVTKAATPKR